MPRKSNFRRVALCAIAFVLSFLLTAAALIYLDLSGRVNNLGTPVMSDRTPPDSYDGLPINVLILGTDTRVGQDIGGGGDQDDIVGRSDTAMVAHISADRKSISVVSIPRDLMVDIPACERKDGSTSYPQHAQFNWAFSTGGEGGDLSSAVFCTWKTVEKFSGMRIDESVVVDFNGFASMIDALDGINVFVPSEINDYQYSGLKLEQGCHEFNGEQALAYARVRHGVEESDGSDLARIQRQQAVMSVMLRTALNKNILTSLNQLYAFAGNGLSALTISDGLSSIPQLAGLGWSLQSIKPENLRFVTLPTYPSPTDSNRVELLEDEAQVIWDAFKNDAPLPGGLEVRDGNGAVYTIPFDEPSTAGTAEGGDPSAVEPATSAEQPAAEPDTVEPATEPSESERVITLNDLPVRGLTDEQIAKLQAECEARG